MNDDPEPLEPAERDYYADLGLDEYATREEIRRAHRRLALQHHPDKGGDPVNFRRVSHTLHAQGAALILRTGSKSLRIPLTLRLSRLDAV
ncbi:hypothetical protein K491DRAFT_690847 [Lophiostoma macrostomum CBS 122681]|uniref:J domain-containing protein n=1 Tax=Lophiostoma macrostomum CBS 122681 TaxID=1314788 RepID=A0A6A6TC85_9PLEO|nr:hypothetical protein K491DRAFT_690847 [Lophiostoma macrostomum CBS 122681]